MMTARVRLFAAVVLFVGWVSLLGYLAATAGRPTVLSKPQLLVSTHVVVARIEADGNAPSTTVAPLIPSEGWKAAAAYLRGLPPPPVEVHLLDLCGKDQGWKGAGQYIIPLTLLPNGKVRLTAIPPSPGYPPLFTVDPAYNLRIYQYTPETLRQLERLLPEK